MIQCDSNNIQIAQGVQPNPNLGCNTEEKLYSVHSAVPFDTTLTEQLITGMQLDLMEEGYYFIQFNCTIQGHATANMGIVFAGKLTTLADVYVMEIGWHQDISVKTTKFVNFIMNRTPTGTFTIYVPAGGLRLKMYQQSDSVVGPVIIHERTLLAHKITSLTIY